MDVPENKLNDVELKNVAGGDDSSSEKKCPYGLHAWKYTGEYISENERRIICPVCGALGWRRYNSYLEYYYNVWDNEGPQS